MDSVMKTDAYGHECKQTWRISNSVEMKACTLMSGQFAMSNSQK